jgi:DNA-binding SARP family transcriptional activator
MPAAPMIVNAESAERGFASALARERARSLVADVPVGELPEPALLVVKTLGSMELRREGRRLDGAWLDRRAGQLFKYLLSERGRMVKVDEIAESVWPGSDYQTGARVRYYVHVLRRALEPQRPPRCVSAYVLCAGGGYRLNEARLQLDADIFQARVCEGLARRSGDPDAAAARLEGGLELYTGEFLADEPYASWAASERQRLHELACEGLAALAELRVAADRLAAASEALARLAALQPYDEHVHRRLIELDLRLGRRSDALRRFAALRSRLRREFGEEPSFTPAQLCRDRTRGGELPQRITSI